MLQQIKTAETPDSSSLPPLEKPAPKGVNLEYVETILLKFFLKSKDEIPKGIKYQRREDQKKLDEKHAIEASNEGLNPEKVAMRGRVRPDHVDTGMCAYHEVVNVSLPSFAEGALRGDMYGLEEPHWFKQTKGRTDLFVVVFAFRFGQPSVENKDKLVKQINYLGRDHWTVTVWDNPNLVTTVNCTKRERAKKPSDRRAVVGRNRLQLFWDKDS